jgi:hypothetical protein
LFFNSNICLEYLDKIWTEIDKEIELQNCEIYTFFSDSDINPFDENGNM